MPFDYYNFTLNIGEQPTAYIEVSGEYSKQLDNSDEYDFGNFTVTNAYTQKDGCRGQLDAVIAVQDIRRAVSQDIYKHRELAKIRHQIINKDVERLSSEDSQAPKRLLKKNLASGQAQHNHWMYRIAMLEKFGHQLAHMDQDKVLWRPLKPYPEEDTSMQGGI